MFSFYSVILDLIKARTHKYVRRIPVGATKTGATKYRYFYHGQEGHGKGLAHESELVVGASFVFSEGENKYHAHITKVDGDMITVKHDDGAKKGTEHIYSKEQFQKLVHHEHRKAIEQAKQKASKQLAEFQQMKERGAKVKQETLDKLQAQVNKLAAPITKRDADLEGVFASFEKQTPKAYTDVQKINASLSELATTLDTKEKTLSFLQMYNDHSQDIINTLDKVVTDQDLYKEYGMLTTLFTSRNDLILNLAKRNFQNIRSNIPLIQKDNLQISGIRKGFKDWIEHTISAIKDTQTEITQRDIDNAKSAYMRTKKQEQIEQTSPFKMSDDMQRFIKNPQDFRLTTQTTSDLIRQIPSVIYRKNADEVISFYLATSNGAKFADIPNIKDILKDQIDRRVDKEAIITAQNIDAVRDRLKGFSEDQEITFENMPILQDTELLDKLFDSDGLDRVRNKLDGTMQASSVKQENTNGVPQNSTQNKQKVKKILGALTGADKEMTSEKLNEGLSNITRLMRTQKDILDTLQQIKTNAPSLLASYKQAYTSKNDVSSAYLKEPFSYTGRYYDLRSKESLVKELITAQVFKNVIYNTDWADESGFHQIDQDNNGFWEREINYAKDHTLEEAIDNLIQHVQKHNAPVIKKAIFMTHTKVLHKALARR